MPASGSTLVALATGVTAKADGEKSGMTVSEMATVTIDYTRRFFFAASYADSSGNTKDPRDDGGKDLLAENNVLIDADGKNWTIKATVNPGGADEHYEVQTERRHT